MTSGLVGDGARRHIFVFRDCSCIFDCRFHVTQFWWNVWARHEWPCLCVRCVTLRNETGNSFDVLHLNHLVDQLWLVLGVKDPRERIKLVESNFRFERGKLRAHRDILKWAEPKQYVRGMILLVTKIEICAAQRWLKTGSSAAAALRAEYIGASAVLQDVKDRKGTRESEPLYYIKGWKEFRDYEARRCCFCFRALWWVNAHMNAVQQGTSTINVAWALAQARLACTISAPDLYGSCRLLSPGIILASQTQ